MSRTLNRRGFLRRSALASSGASLAFHFEERALLAQQTKEASPPATHAPANPFPHGKLGRLTVSRLICGGNLISGFAHSRDLIYVSPLLKHYFTDEKIFETLALCENHGINTAILRLDEDTLRILDHYRKQRGGRIQWIAQVKIQPDDFSEISRAVAHGAVAVFVHGGVCDALASQGKTGVLARAVAAIKQEGVVAGIAGHSLDVVKACEQANVAPDFYMKTFNSKRYWSAGALPRHDSVWEETPEEIKALMEEVERPWIAYKVLGAGAIHPREGFQYAFQNGADFLCVGMFDFQVAEDAALARLALEKCRLRSRAWA
jgi:hypothetical protein